MNVYKKIEDLIRSIDVSNLLGTIGINDKSGIKNILIIAGGVAATVCVVTWGTNKLFGRLSSWGLPGPRDTVFPFSLLNRNKREHQLHLLLHDYVQEYGETFAFNYKGQPTVVTSNEEIIHKLLWKEFPNFTDRKFYVDMPWPCHEMITMAKGKKAKAIRHLLTSILGADSVKDSWQHFVGAAQSVNNVLSDAAKNSTSVDVASLANGYVMEILTKMAFSLDLANHSKENQGLVEYSQLFTRPPAWLQTCGDIPILKYFTNIIPSGYNSRIAPFIKIGLDIVKQRRAMQGHQPQDILDILLTTQSNDKSVTDEILLAQAIVLLTIVHGTTSFTITMVTYFIAKHQDIQRKLQEEIDRVTTKSDIPSYDQIHKELNYLDRVISETVRLYPSGFMLMRECTGNTTINNISFKKGDAVLVPTYSIHRNPKFYPNPQEFNPDRFQTVHSKHYYPYGDGYRRCAGRQMAALEMKMFLFRLLKNYNVSLVDDQKQPNVKSYVTIQAMMAVEEPIEVIVQKRNN